MFFPDENPPHVHVTSVGISVTVHELPGALRARRGLERLRHAGTLCPVLTIVGK
jgi:hypothetical protein